MHVSQRSAMAISIHAIGTSRAYVSTYTIIIASPNSGFCCLAACLRMMVLTGADEADVGFWRQARHLPKHACVPA
eukprot:m.140502 g.140502  ORF g.140502 m.140502 type:complete len:75 (-) comp15963_c0_seq3:2653-2877(-)